MQKFLLVFLLTCAGCTTEARDPARATAPQTPAATAPAVSASSADSLARLRAMVADTTCTLPEHCQTVPVGAVACGGPQAYLPFSTLRVNAGEVLAQGERHKAARQAEIKAGGLMSSCRYLPDPGAVCTSGACQLGGSSAAAQ